MRGSESTITRQSATIIELELQRNGTQAGGWLPEAHILASLFKGGSGLVDIRMILLPVALLATSQSLGSVHWQASGSLIGWLARCLLLVAGPHGPQHEAGTPSQD